MKKLTIIAGIIFLCAFSSAAQQGPAAEVCISQEAAQECAKCVTERKGLRELVDTLKTAREKDTTIIRDLEVRLAVEVQKAVDLQAEITRQQALIQFLLTNGRKKIRIGLINF